MRELVHPIAAQQQAARAAAPTTPPQSLRALASRIGNRGMGALLAQTSPPNMADPGEVAPEEPIELTTPDGGTGTADAGAPADAGSGAPAPVPVQNPTSLTVKGTGALEGSYKVSQYWPVTKYWGTDDQLGKFDEPSSGGWRMIGHKFQVIGQFTSGTTTTGAGGKVTFLQEARITNTKGGTAGAWFDDMDYTDAGGGKHTWDPNAEAGTTVKTGYPGVRRTLGTDKYAYTDPPAMGYRPGTTNAYRKLEFRIHLKPPPGSSGSEIIKTATQEIEIVNGVPTVLQAP